MYFEIKDIKEAKQVSHILFFCGDEGLRRFNSWRLPEAEGKKPETVWTRFGSEIVKPTENFRVARLRMQKLMQEESENIDNYVSKLKLQAYKCDLRDDDDVQARVIEQLIAGTRHADLQKDLLQKPKTFTMEEALDMGRAHEASLTHMKDLADLKAVATTAAHAVQVKKKQCMRCGGKQHSKPENCPAMGGVCHVCGKANHWANVCRSKKSSNSEDDEQHASGYKGGSNPRKRYNPKAKDVQPKNVHAVSDMSEEQFGQLETVNFSIVNSTSDQLDTRDEVYATLGVSLANRPNIQATLKVKVDTGEHASQENLSADVSGKESAHACEEQHHTHRV